MQKFLEYELERTNVIEKVSEMVKKKTHFPNFLEYVECERLTLDKIIHNFMLNYLINNSIHHQHHHHKDETAILVKLYVPLPAILKEILEIKGRHFCDCVIVAQKSHKECIKRAQKWIRDDCLVLSRMYDKKSTSKKWDKNHSNEHLYYRLIYRSEERQHLGLQLEDIICEECRYDFSVYNDYTLFLTNK